MEREGGISPRLSPLAQVCVNLSSLEMAAIEYLVLSWKNMASLSFRLGTQGISWPGRVLVFLVLTLMNMLLNTRAVNYFHYCFFIIGEKLCIFQEFSSDLPLGLYLYLYSALDLIEHLRAMGETNALLQRNKAGFFFLLSWLFAIVTTVSIFFNKILLLDYQNRFWIAKLLLPRQPYMTPCSPQRTALYLLLSRSVNKILELSQQLKDNYSASLFKFVLLYNP